MTFALWVAGGYLVGSIPVAWILTRMVSGRDLRELGSGNVGVMNTALSVHRWTAALVFFAEVVKGVLAVVLPRVLGADEFTLGCTVIAAVLGTRYPIWLRGHGGRGNTLGAAALAAYAPLALIALIVVFIAARVLTKRNFRAMRATLMLVPFAIGIVTGSWYGVLFGAVFSLVFLSGHREETDDHLLVKQQFPTLWDFITAPRRRE